jgi:hypothetical protein
MATKKPIGIVVRRGALRRFDALTRKTAELPVEITWDRRLEDRRSSDDTAGVERRSGDRRRKPPFTWEAADFVVVDESQARPSETVEEPQRKRQGGR